MSTSVTAGEKSLVGLPLFAAAILIGLGNFLVVLNTTIANVSVPTIAGNLGISSSQGTWVITSYAVAEAITVPLTGFLAKRFGAQRVFLWCYVAFAFASLLCGISQSIGMLLGMRVLMGLVGGPIMPLSQMLLLRIFPKEKATLGTVIWAMTTLIGPVAGPILGGIICDSIGWPWIFFIMVPMALAGGSALIVLLRGRSDPTAAAKVDGVGLGLLVLWVGALQILLDEGRNQDWFNSPEICLLGVIAAIGFAAFLIWEITEANPIVNLKIFRHRGFVAAATTYSVGFGAFFASLVLLPLWMQTNLGYTATWAGYATGIMGIFAVLTAPLVGKAVEKIDARLVVSLGIVGLGLISVWRMGFTPDVTFLQMVWPTLLTGPFMVMFFVPVTGLAMASVEHEEQANAAGLSNFMRTLAGAFATSMVQTGWSDATRRNQTELAGVLHFGEGLVAAWVKSLGATRDQATELLTHLVEAQSVMLATLNMFAVIALCFGFAATLIWIAPKPQGPIDTSGAH